MQPESIRKVWLGLAIIQLALAMTIMGEIQGSHLIPGIKTLVAWEFLKNTPDSIVALWGVLLLSILLAVTSGLTAAHARLCGKKWRSRYPLRLLEVDPDADLGRWMPRIGVLLAVLVPAWTLGHCWRVLHNEGILCVQQPDGSWIAAGRGWSGLWSLPQGWNADRLFSDGYRLAGEAGCDAGTTTFIPFFEPLLFLMLTLWALVNMLRAGGALFRSDSANDPSLSEDSTDTSPE